LTEMHSGGSCISYKFLSRAASSKYQLDLEMARRSSFFGLARGGALRALVAGVLFWVRWVGDCLFTQFFCFDAPGRPGWIEGERRIRRLVNSKVKFIIAG